MARRNPDLRRYDHLPVWPALYVIEAGEYVKVGRATKSIFSRLRELHSYLTRQGMTPGRFRVALMDTDDYEATRKAEVNCLEVMRKVANTIEGRTEYFTGITFDEALAALGHVFVSEAGSMHDEKIFAARQPVIQPVTR